MCVSGNSTQTELLPGFDWSSAADQLRVQCTHTRLQRAWEVPANRRLASATGLERTNRSQSREMQEPNLVIEPHLDATTLQARGLDAGRGVGAAELVGAHAGVADLGADHAVCDDSISMLATTM